MSRARARETVDCAWPMERKCDRGGAQFININHEPVPFCKMKQHCDSGTGDSIGSLRALLLSSFGSEVAGPKKKTLQTQLL